MMFLHFSTSRTLTLLLDLLGRGVLFGYRLCHLEKLLFLSFFELLRSGGRFNGYRDAEIGVGSLSIRYETEI